MFPGAGNSADNERSSRHRGRQACAAGDAGVVTGLQLHDRVLDQIRNAEAT